MVAGLPVGAVANVALCSVKQMRRAVQDGAECFALLLSPTNADVTKEVRLAEGGRSSDSTSQWDKLVDEFLNVFEPPGKPVECAVKH